MKSIQKIIFLSLVSAFCLSSNIFAQAKTEKEITIIKKVIDENGVETEEKITLKGEDAEKYIKEQGIKISKTETAEGEVEMTVTVEAAEDENQEVNIWISEEAEEHEIKSGDDVIFFDAKGKELPEDIKKLLIEKGIDVEELIKEQGEGAIITKGQYKIVEIDDDGNKKVLEWDGEGEMPSEMKELMDKHDHESTSKTIKKKIMVIEEDVDIEKVEGKQTITIKKNKNGEESVQVMVLGENEELPQEVLDMLQENNIDLDQIPEDGKVRIEIEKEDHGLHQHDDEEVTIMKIKMHDAPQNKAQLGVMIEDGANGVIVTDLIDGGAAKLAGVLENDIITKVNKIKVTNSDELINALSSMSPGDKVKLTIFRNGELEKIKLQLQAPKVDAASEYRTEHKMLKIKGGDINKCEVVAEPSMKNLTEEEVEIIEETINVEKAEIVDIQTGPNTLNISTLDLFPNPTDGNIRVRFNIDNKEETNVKVIDLAGRTVYEKNLNNFSGQFDEEIELPKNKLGSMVLVISQGKNVFTEKIILN